MNYPKLLSIVVICSILLQIAISYSEYGAPAEFGNLTNTTCWIGGDLGELRCLGAADFGELEVPSLNVTGDIDFNGTFSNDYINITDNYIYGDIFFPGSIYLGDYFDGDCRPAGEVVQYIDEWGTFYCFDPGIYNNSAEINSTFHNIPSNCSDGYAIIGFDNNFSTTYCQEFQEPGDYVEASWDNVTYDFELAYISNCSVDQSCGNIMYFTDYGNIGYYTTDNHSLETHAYINNCSVDMSCDSVAYDSELGIYLTNGTDANFGEVDSVQFIINSTAVITKDLNNDIVIKLDNKTRAVTTTVSIQGDNRDGWVYQENATWAGVHAAPNGKSADNSSMPLLVRAQWFFLAPNMRINRGFLFFDTSSLPDGATIESVDLWFLSDNVEATISVQKGTQTNQLTIDDFDAFTGDFYNHTTEVGDFVWNKMSFNSQGLLDINKTGDTKLCLREYEHDYLDVTPGTSDYLNELYPNEVGGGNEPWLNITYSVEFKDTQTLKVIDANGDIIITMNDTGIDVNGNITADNVFLPAYVSSHTNDTIAVASAGVWYNVTFDHGADEFKKRITHNPDDGTNTTFIIQDDGIYEITYTLSFEDSAVVPNSHIVTRVTNNDVELNGFTIEIDLGLQNQDASLHHSDLVELATDDEIVLSFTSDDTTVSLISHLTYGIHRNTGHLTIKRIA